MEIYLYVIVPVLTIAGGLAVYYLQQRLKNAATKDDIKGLTAIAQSVKNDLDLLHDSKLSFQTLRRNAIIKYYKSLLRLVNYMAALQLTQDTGLKQREISNRQALEFEQLVAKVDNAESNLRLFLVEFDKVYPEIEAISMLTTEQGKHYEYGSERLIGIDKNTYLIPDIINEYDTDRFLYAQKVFNHIEALQTKLREYIKESLEKP